MAEIIAEREARVEVMEVLGLHDNDLVAGPAEAEPQILPPADQIEHEPQIMDQNLPQAEVQEENKVENEIEEIEDDYGEESVAEEGLVRFSAPTDRSPIELLSVNPLSRGLF